MSLNFLSLFYLLQICNMLITKRGIALSFSGDKIKESQKKKDSNKQFVL